MKQTRFFDKNDYNFYVEEYKRMSLERNRTISHSELRKEPFNLPDARWYVNNCPDKNVKTWSDFVDWCGFVARGKLSKEKAANLILKKQSELNRPLMYNDFRDSTGCYDISIKNINDIWGSINKMKEDLGLEIIQENMVERKLSKDEFDLIINNIVHYLHNEKKDFITDREIDSNKEIWHSCQSLRKYSKRYYNCQLSELFKKYGIRMGNPGRGLVYEFPDGEKTSSQFEYIFSKWLKENGFVYGINYYRDVKYSSFINNCKNNMNCDYVIVLDDTVLYIEIAGIIEAYKQWYYENKEITISKTKEKYRKKLLEKENMLKSNGLIYYILFPCDLTNDNFSKIINEHSLSLKHDIESFIHHNIDWIKVMNFGELNYNDKSIIRNTKAWAECC